MTVLLVDEQVQSIVLPKKGINTAPASCLLPPLLLKGMLNQLISLFLH